MPALGCVAVCLTFVVASCSNFDPRAKSLYDYWKAGDRDVPADVATPRAVVAMFSLRYDPADRWEFQHCDPGPGPHLCEWRALNEDLLTFYITDDGVDGVDRTSQPRPPAGLVKAWRAGDSRAALPYATPEVIFTLFSHHYDPLSHWRAPGGNDTAGVCEYSNDAGERFTLVWKTNVGHVYEITYTPAPGS